MSKDLEEGEIEDGELPEELGETFVADDVGLDTSLPAGHKCLPGLKFAPAVCRSPADLQKPPFRKQI